MTRFAMGVAFLSAMIMLGSPPSTKVHKYMCMKFLPWIWNQIANIILFSIDTAVYTA